MHNYNYIINHVYVVIKKLFILLLFVALTTSTLATSNIVFAEGRMEDGITFPNASEVYDTMESLKVMPKTFEAYIHIPTSQTKRAGIIFGNYGPDNTTASYSFEVYSDGYPTLYYDVDNIVSLKVNNQAKSTDYVATNVAYGSKINAEYKKAENIIYI